MRDNYIKQLEAQNAALLEAIAKPHTLNVNPSLVIKDPSGTVAEQARTIERLKKACNMTLIALKIFKAEIGKKGMIVPLWVNNCIDALIAEVGEQS